LLKILSRESNFDSSMNSLTVRIGPLLLRTIAQEAAYAWSYRWFVVVLGIGILVAHALDAFRSDSAPDTQPVRPIDCKAIATPASET
jgi:hypothetical protein